MAGFFRVKIKRMIKEPQTVAAIARSQRSISAI
jgi:hypothetical protein